MKKKTVQLIILCFIFIDLSCSINMENNSMVTITKKFYGLTKNNEDVFKYEMKSKSGTSISVINYGGIIDTWKTKDRNNKIDDIALGYNSLKEYESNNPYFGAIIGRYGNRIEKGRFMLEGKKYSLNKNNNENHLHGGIKGFDKVIWNAREIKSDSSASIELTYLSKDMEEGYPGNLEVKITYTLNSLDELIVDYEAKTDKKTVINLTQHSYFNLTGDFNKNILDHEVLINSNSFLPVDSLLIPTGQIKNVNGTPFDFRKSKKIGEDINTENRQLKYGGGYDHCWVINRENKKINFVASVYESNSGRLLEIFSSEPGVQFYTGNFLDGTLPSKNGNVYNKRTGFCLETQHFPNSPNEKNFPSTTLSPEDTYKSKTIYKFSNR